MKKLSEHNDEILRQHFTHLYYNIIPFTVIATKADKISKSAGNKSVINIASVYKCGAGNIIAVSSQTRQGLEDVLLRIQSVTEKSADD